MGYFQSGVTFSKSVIPSGATPPTDYICGIVFYDTAPNAWPGTGIKECLSIQDAINGGLDGLHEDETKGKVTLTITAEGSTGDTYQVAYVDCNGVQTILCTYTQVSGDSTSTLLATSINNAINANTPTSGFSATSSTDTIVVTIKAGQGIFPNTGTPLTVVCTNNAGTTFTYTQASTTDGVGSKWDVFYYHISEFFRINANGVLWTGIFTDPTVGDYTFAEVTTLQQASAGTCRRIGVYAPTETIVSNGLADIALINAVCATLDTNKMPCNVFLAEDMHSVSDLTTLPTLAVNPGYDYVSVNISQDGADVNGGGQGNYLYKALGKSVTNLGAMLGLSSSISVAASIAQPIATNNISNGVENAKPALANGTLISSVSVPLQTQLGNYSYIYAGNFTGYNGTYFSVDFTCSVQNTNYSYIWQNLVEQKIERIMYQAYLPYVAGGITVNADGTIYAPQVRSLESVGDNALLQMLQAGELSALETVISPTQNVKGTNKLIVSLYDVTNSIAYQIGININSVNALP